MTVENELFDLEYSLKEMENRAATNRKLVEEMGAELKIKLDKRLGG